MNKLKIYITLVLSCVVIMGCASSSMIQPQINSFVVAEKYNLALKTLKENQHSYGENNRLLYLMDHGFILHSAGRYEESIQSFEKAKSLYDRLYTKSITDMAQTWLINDNAAPYRGEDFERPLINVFQALNFIALDKNQKALVEARNANNYLRLLNTQYKTDRQNVYKEDAFVHFFMGLIYEANNTFEDVNNAFIEYKRAYEVYKKDFIPNYFIYPSEILNENLLSVSKEIDEDYYNNFKKSHANTKYRSVSERSESAEVYLIHYQGLAPIKIQTSIPIPIPNGNLARLSFPYYETREVEELDGIFKAVDELNNEVTSKTVVSTDIRKIAQRNLENRRARVIAKSALRGAAKQFVTQGVTRNIKKNGSDVGADSFRFLANIYNLTSEQADLRSWQTLPATINITRLFLKEGEYSFFLNKKFICQEMVKKGQKKFLIVRTTK